LLSDVAWLHRRKETVEILDDEWVRRRTSIDFTIPPLMHPAYHGLFLDDLRARYLVPVTLLPKLPPTLMRFDVEDEDGKSLYLPTLRQCHLAAYAAMQWSALDMLSTEGLNRTGYTLPARLRWNLLTIATADPATAAAVARRLLTGEAVPWPADREAFADATSELTVADEELVEWSTALSRGERPFTGLYDTRPVPLKNWRVLVETTNPAERTPFARMVWTLAFQTLVLADILGSPNARKRIKLSYEERIIKAAASGQADVVRSTALQQAAAADVLWHDSGRPERFLKTTYRLGWQPMSMALVMPYARAQAYHVEVQAPDGLEINDTRVLVRRTGGAFLCSGALDEDVRHGSRVHRYVRPASDIEGVVLHLELRADRLGFVAGAPLAAFGVLLLLVGLAAFPTEAIQSTGNVPPFLLLFPTLFVTLAARVGAGSIVARLLRAARGALLASGILAYLAAIPFLVVETGGDATPSSGLRWYWIALAALASLPVVALVLARLLPRPWPEACAVRIPHPERALERWLRWAVWLPARVALSGPRIELAAVRLTRPQVEELLAAAPDAPRVGIAVRPWTWRWREPLRYRFKLASHFDGQPLLDSMPGPGGDVLPMRAGGADALANAVNHLLHGIDGAAELAVTWAGIPEEIDERARTELVSAVRAGALRANVRYRVRAKSEEEAAPR
jgi:hypothetical protein